MRCAAPFNIPSIDRSGTRAVGILAENTPIYDSLKPMLSERNSASLAWRDLFDNIWDM